MSACERRGGDAGCDIERKQALAEVIGLTRVAMHQLAEWPLQKQEEAQGQHQPLGHCKRGRQCPTQEPSQYAHDLPPPACPHEDSMERGCRVRPRYPRLRGLTFAAHVTRAW